MARAAKRRFRATSPNVGTEALYRRRMLREIDAMQASIMRFVVAAYRRNEPKVAELAQDEGLPARALQRSVDEMRDRWTRRFDEAARRLAWWFAKDVERRSTKQLHRILRDGGFSVRFNATPAVRDILQATVQANVSLIKTIPAEHFAKIEGMVMRSVQAGRDLQQLEADLRSAFGVTRRRAALIARDQNNKATSAIQRARQLEVGLTEAIWVHSGGGREPRPKHVRASGTRYDLRRGLPIGDKGQWVHPGEEINCRCVSRPVVPGFD